MRRVFLPLVVAVAAVVAVPACSSSPTGLAGQDLTNSKSYSLTQTITNNSYLDMTVQSVTADNGGTVAPGSPSVVPKNGGMGTFKATNTGNGVQTKVTLTSSSGQTLVVDSDVPKVDRNWSNATIAGPRGPLNAGNIAIGGGDNPTASFVLETCTYVAWQCVTTASTNTSPPVGDPSKTPAGS